MPGPLVSSDIRGAGWVEAAVLGAALRSLTGDDLTEDEPGSTRVESKSPRRSVRECVDRRGRDRPVAVDAGEVLDETVLRSYCIGAVHQGLGWASAKRWRSMVLGMSRPDGPLVSGSSRSRDALCGGRGYRWQRTAGQCLGQRFSPRRQQQRGSVPAFHRLGRSRPDIQLPAIQLRVIRRWSEMSTPVGPYSPVVRAGPYVVCSGQVGLENGSAGVALAEGRLGPQTAPGNVERGLGAR